MPSVFYRKLNYLALYFHHHTGIKQSNSFFSLNSRKKGHKTLWKSNASKKTSVHKVSNQHLINFNRKKSFNVIHILQWKEPEQICIKFQMPGTRAWFKAFFITCTLQMNLGISVWNSMYYVRKIRIHNCIHLSILSSVIASPLKNWNLMHFRTRALAQPHMPPF